MLFWIAWSSLWKNSLLSLWTVGNLMLEKQASAFGRGERCKKIIYIHSFKPIGGILWSPVVNDKTSSRDALCTCDFVRYSTNQSYISASRLWSACCELNKNTGLMTSTFFFNAVSSIVVIMIHDPFLKDHESMIIHRLQVDWQNIIIMQ